MHIVENSVFPYTNFKLSSVKFAKQSNNFAVV